MRIWVLGLCCMVPKTENFLRTRVERKHMETQVRRFVAQYGIIDRGGYLGRVECFMVADAKGKLPLQTARSGREQLPLWQCVGVCGKNYQGCWADFAMGTSRIANVWG